MTDEIEKKLENTELNTDVHILRAKQFLVLEIVRHTIDSGLKLLDLASREWIVEMIRDDMNDKLSEIEKILK